MTRRVPLHIADLAQRALNAPNDPRRQRESASILREVIADWLDEGDERERSYARFLRPTPAGESIEQWKRDRHWVLAGLVAAYQRQEALAEYYDSMPLDFTP